MAAHGRRKKKKSDRAEEHADERWLLTYADMITLLMALFIVMWSMATVNTSKYEALSASLKDAFSGKILPGGAAVVRPGSSSQDSPAAPEPPLPSIVPAQPGAEGEAKGGQGDGTRSDAARQEVESLDKLKRDVDAYVRAHGLEREVETVIARRGLVVRVLTDKVLYASGTASLKRESHRLLDALSRLFKVEVRSPIQVEGNTDSVPVRGRFPTNWELSTARATAVVRYLIARGVSPDRLAATGYADRHPIATNATEAGRRRNRRVELVVLRRMRPVTGHGGQDTSHGGTG